MIPWHLSLYHHLVIKHIVIIRLYHITTHIIGFVISYLISHMNVLCQFVQDSTCIASRQGQKEDSVSTPMSSEFSPSQLINLILTHRIPMWSTLKAGRRTSNFNWSEQPISLPTLQRTSRPPPSDRMCQCRIPSPSNFILAASGHNGRSPCCAQDHHHAPSRSYTSHSLPMLHID